MGKGFYCRMYCICSYISIQACLVHAIHRDSKDLTKLLISMVGYPRQNLNFLFVIHLFKFDIEVIVLCITFFYFTQFFCDLYTTFSILYTTFFPFNFFYFIYKFLYFVYNFSIQLFLFYIQLFVLATFYFQPIRNILRPHCSNHLPKFHGRFRFGAIFCVSY
jgi:hypothetical protein